MLNGAQSGNISRKTVKCMMLLSLKTMLSHIKNKHPAAMPKDGSQPKIIGGYKESNQMYIYCPKSQCLNRFYNLYSDLYIYLCNVMTLRLNPWTFFFIINHLFFNNGCWFIKAKWNKTSPNHSISGQKPLHQYFNNTVGMTIGTKS